MISSNTSGEFSYLWVAPQKAYPLGRELGRGGESCVYAFGRGAAKVYHRHRLEDQRENHFLRKKVDQMCALRAFHDDTRFAWPLFSIYSDAGASRWAGYAMRIVSGASAQVLGALRTLQHAFPDWNRLHVATVAINLLDGLIELEARGLTIGDVSLNNFRVDHSCRVSFIDLDSYQLVANGAVYGCPVVTLRYAAPELITQGACAAARTPESVRFAVAMVVYEILTYGLSPYMRTWGDDPIANLIEGKTAIGGRRATAYVPPDLFSRYTSLHPAVMRMCIEAFVDGHRNPAARPTLHRWRRAVETHRRCLAGQVSAA